MKVVITSGIFPPDVGGPATYVPKLAEYLQANGDQVEVVSLTDKNAHLLKNPWPVHLVARKDNKFLRFLKTIKKLRTVVTNSDIVFANGLHEEVAIATFRTKFPRVAKVVGDPVWERATNAFATTRTIEEFANITNLSFKFKLERLFLVWSLNQFSLVICPSENLTNLVSSWGVKTKVIYVPNGVQNGRKPIMSKRFDLCSTSRLVGWKNVGLLIEAASTLNLSIGIAGGGPEERNLRNLAETLNTKATFLGHLSHNQLSQVMRSSKLFILFSDYEGMSFSLLDAMAHGIPVIVSDAPGNLSLIRNLENGLVVSRGNLQELISTIGFALENYEFMLQLSRNATEVIDKEYSEEVIFQRTRKLMISVLTHHE